MLNRLARFICKILGHQAKELKESDQCTSISCVRCNCLLKITMHNIIIPSGFNFVWGSTTETVWEDE